MVGINIKEIEITFDFGETWHDAWYVDDDKEIKFVFYSANDEPAGIYNYDCEEYILPFGYWHICINGLDFNNINKENYNDYELIEILVDEYCGKSLDRVHPNKNGFCTCEDAGSLRGSDSESD